MKARRLIVQVHFHGAGDSVRPAAVSLKLRTAGRRVLVDLVPEARGATSIYLLYRRRAGEVVIAGSPDVRVVERLLARMDARGAAYAIARVPLVDRPLPLDE